MTLKELLEKNAAIKAKKAAAVTEKQKIFKEAENKIEVTEKISGEEKKETVEENTSDRGGRKPRRRAYLVVDDTVNNQEQEESQEDSENV